MAAIDPARAAPVPPGSHRIVFAEERGSPPGAMEVYLHRPAAWQPDGPVVVVMHGNQRNPDLYRDAWVPHAEAFGFLLVCPGYSEAHFPGTWWYNFGNAVDGDGRAQPAAAWSFGALDDAVAAARAACGGTGTDYALYGHSAGAQFVHRALLLTGLPRARRIVIANAGSYAMPRFDVAFPFGLGGTAATEATLGAALGRPVTLMLGEADIDPSHESLPRGPGPEAQGPYRFARGQAFFAAAREAAGRLGVSFAWQLKAVPGVGHSNSGMALAAAPLLI
jgi:poly(3-hydroxybutyrate) depolymerase